MRIINFGNESYSVLKLNIPSTFQNSEVQDILHNFAIFTLREKQIASFCKQD